MPPDKNALWTDAWVILGPMLGLTRTVEIMNQALAAGRAAATKLVAR
jgi:hypothetical protein